MRTSTEAIVLRRTDYGEGDRIVNFLTPGMGKVSALAKGVRKPSSKLAGGIEPFSVVNVTLLKGRSELRTLVSSSMQVNYGNIIKDFSRVQLGYLVLKKINQAAETLEEPELYDVLKTALASLDRAEIDIRIIEAWFHLQYLQLLGHGLNLSRDSAGMRLAEDRRYNFSLADMSFAVHEKGDFAADHLKVFKILQLKTPAVVASVSGLAGLLDECLRLLRALDE